GRTPHTANDVLHRLKGDEVKCSMPAIQSCRSRSPARRVLPGHSRANIAFGALCASRSRFINWTGGTRYNILNKGLTSISMNPGARPGLSFARPVPRAVHHRAHRRV